MPAGANNTRMRSRPIYARRKWLGSTSAPTVTPHYDEEIGGWSWQSYPLTHMAGFSQEVALTPPAVANVAPPRGMILHDQLEARVLPRITGPLGPGDLQYSAMWKVAQRLTSESGIVRTE